MRLRVIPVLDVKSGRAVRAVAGVRDHYGPVQSILHPGSDPIALARAYRDRLGLQELYLADLDAIAGAPPSVALYEGLHSLGLSLWVDAGVRDATSLSPLLRLSVATIVVGLETVRGPAGLMEVVDRTGPGRLVFSLDLRNGLPLLAEGEAWGTPDPVAIAEQALALGMRRLLLLDLSRVGTGRGTGTLALLRVLASAHADLEWAVGGGVSSLGEFQGLEDAGASVLLLGTSLHDGTFGREELARGDAIP